ncbi:hypothetical protein [Vannielia litorea]|uniref:hypothetical protein n=1 Tax=Vannielia litorea TaxID=1217970 RepID=UPI001BCD1B34|nr:hypothetical protein [Vannielia litorea]MBS8227523.1 hypothetical protein [Vannielia litorea]
MDELHALRDGLARCRAAPLRDARKIGKGLAHQALELEKSGALKAPDAMTLAIEALGLGADVHTYPQRYRMARARLLAARRAALGLPEPEVALEKAVTLDVEAGMLLISDESLDVWSLLEASAPQVALAGAGAAGIALGGDGRVKIRLRLHASGPAEPLASEFRRLRQATPEMPLVCTSGAVVIQSGGAKRLRMPVPPGAYSLAAFGLGLGRAPQCLVILSPQFAGPPPAPAIMPELPL